MVYGIGQILPRILHLAVFTTYLTNQLTDKSEYAAYLDLYAYTAVIIVLFSYRMDTALFRFGKRSTDLPQVYGTALFPIFLSSAALLGLGFMYAQELATWLTYPDKPQYVQWFSAIIAFDIINLIPFAKLRIEGRAKLFVAYKLINVTLTIVLVLLFLESSLLDGLKLLFPRADDDISFVFIANLIASGVIFLLLIVFHFPKSVTIDYQLWRKMAWYGAPLIVVGVAANINQYFAVPLQKYFLGTEIVANKDQAAVYGAVQKIAGLLALFTTAFNYAAEPFFFKNSDRQDAKELYGQIALYFVIAAGLVSVGLYGLLDIFQLIIGDQYRDNLFLIPILLMSYLFLGLYYNVSIWYKLSDQTYYGALISTIGAVITLSGSVILLPYYGVSASAWISLTCYATMVILGWFLGRIHYPIQYPVMRIIAYILFTAITLISIWISHQYLEWTLVSGFFIICIFILIIWRLEMRQLKELLQ